MRTVAIVNQKGGCGKTTTAINLAGVLARFGERTLLVDLDPQGHCAAGLAVPEEQIETHIGDAMLAVAGPPEESVDAGRLLWRIRKNLDLAPSAMALAGLEAARGGLADAPDRDERLARVLAPLADDYDLCLIDCPPSIGLLTYNALRAADEVLIPVETGFFALHGAGRQVQTLRALAKRVGVSTPFRLLVTMHDENSSLGNELLAELKRRFGDRVIPVVIRLDRRLKDAASMGQPVIEFAPGSIGTQDYSDLAAWLLGRPVLPHESQPALADVGPLRPLHAADGASHPSERQAPAAIHQPHPPGGCRENPEPVAVADPPAPTATRRRQDDPVMARAAELALRAKQLLRKGEQLQERLRRDPDVSRVLPTLSGSAPAPAEPATVPGPLETPVGVVFRHAAGPGQRIAIAGDFNRWSPDRTALRYNPQTGLHECVVSIPPGRCEYRLVIDGVWRTDPTNPSISINPFGETNSVLVVTGQTHAVCEGAD